MANGDTITAGIDIGSSTSKAVILSGGEIASYSIGPSSVSPSKTARLVFERALSSAGITREQVAYVIGTGYGRARVEFADENVSEISCHARGAHHLLPEVRTVVDIGGQDTKAIRIDNEGLVADFVMNDKCAAGTGRFLDFMARSMDLEIKDMVRLHFGEGDPAMISSMCSVFAESEVINLINEEVPLPSIIKGLHKSVANRIRTLAKRVGMEKEIVITGGVAKNRGVVETLEEILECRFVGFPDIVDPQIVGALGAAVIAFEKS
ncbi:MAG: acyl-CoA dehydratase activase [Pseudomonadota bacterium]